MIHARHLSGFTTDQRTTRLFAAFGNTGDHPGGSIDIQFAGRVIVEEEEGLSTGDHQVVHTHGDEVNTDSVMTRQIHRQAQLGADAVSAGNQHRFFIFLRYRTQRTETTQPAHNFRTACLFDNMLNTGN